MDLKLPLSFDKSYSSAHSEGCNWSGWSCRCMLEPRVLVGLSSHGKETQWASVSLRLAPDTHWDCQASVWAFPATPQLPGERGERDRPVCRCHSITSSSTRPNTKSTGMIGRVTNSLSTLTTGDYSITLPLQYSYKTPKAGV